MQTVVISGGTSGVGYAIAKDLVPDNQVIIIGRNPEKGYQAAQRLGSNATFVAADLATDVGVETARKEIEKVVTHIDVLVLSAGVWASDAQENIDVNLRPYYTLTKALQPLLGGGQVLMVTGNPAAVQRLPISELQLNQTLRAGWLLAHKTLLMLWLSHDLAADHIRVNSFFPGDIHSDLMPYTQQLTKTDVPVGKFLILDDRFSTQTGQFYDDQGRVVPLSPGKYNLAEAQKRLAKYIAI
ncbi:SDR family NAD(P)-dependent oxidoreductase [Lactobacillaceae bacterium L1_55_11]|nr:SDR family NAD(P)-dependent oxidoreductase [Lactobacillaceae bacterium L1_55_11]